MPNIFGDRRPGYFFLVWHLLQDFVARDPRILVLVNLLLAVRKSGGTAVQHSALFAMVATRLYRALIGLPLTEQQKVRTRVSIEGGRSVSQLPLLSAICLSKFMLATRGRSKQ